MIMQNSVLNPNHQSMEDSTAMTIEFLRARLLSERSISRSAKQRADELAKKVMELEEQLRMANLQRKMAEKATADVLAILENQGISDVSEEYDLGSDHEIHCESGVGNDSAKEGEKSMCSKGRQHGSDELSGSDVDSSPVSGRSLSWKGRHDSPCSLEKYKTSYLRRQSSFSSIGSSPTHRLGKSRRKIRHRQTRLVVEESRDEFINVNCQQNEVIFSSEGFPNCSGGGPNIPIESKIQEADDSEVNVANKNHHVDEYGREKDMRQALEHQAQLLDQYEAMEKAQGDWEEKFRGNNSPLQDSCDRENHSDMTEEKDEIKVQFLCSAKVVNLNAQEDKAQPTFDDKGDCCNNPKSTTFSTSDLLDQENSHSLLKGSQNGSLVNCRYQAYDKNQQDPRRHGYPNSKPTDSFPTDVYGGMHQKDASRNKNDLYALVSHDQSHKFSGVLESLEQARMSLRQEFNRLPLVEGGYTSKAIINSSTFVGKSEDRFGIPVGCPGLFRLPTDFSDETTARPNVHASTHGFSSNCYADRIISRSYDAQFCTNPHSGTLLSLSEDDRPIVTGYLENEPRIDSKMSPYDPFSGGGLFSSGKYVYPTFPFYPSYQNASTHVPFGGRLSRPYSISTVGVPLAYNFSFHDDHLKSNMYMIP